MNIRALVTLVVLASVLPSCLTQRNLDQPPPGVAARPEPRLEASRDKDADGRVIRERFLLVQQDEKPIAHGADVGWYSDGKKRFERRFAHDKPTGTWRTWHANGQLESEVEFGGPDKETTMRFWYQDGHLSAEGPARDGSRCGTWRFYRPDGTLREEGTYVDSQRDGVWSLREADGRELRLVYARGVIVERR
ncbi:MAG: hypothetical protein JNL28_11570 [Planctomycetes bacterium]|nr:hypothetical protein [Planctomycetota bacterium]